MVLKLLINSGGKRQVLSHVVQFSVKECNMQEKNVGPFSGGIVVVLLKKSYQVYV